MTADWKEKMVQKADEVFLKTLEETGITMENAHLQLEKTRSLFQKTLERELGQNGVDLSFMSAESPLAGKIGGNACGIASDYCCAVFTRPWEKVCMTPSEIKKHFAICKNAKAYQGTRYGGVIQIEKDELANISFGTTYRNQGIGSCALMIEESTTLYTDKEGNLMADHSTLVWD